jgi:hypothetical protein
MMVLMLYLVAFLPSLRDLYASLSLLGINLTQPDPKRKFKSQISSKQIRIMIISEV